MRPELETYQLIDNYLNGELTGEDLQAFEQKLQSDPSFAEEVSFQQLTNEVVVGASFDSLRSQMTADIAKIDTSKNIRTWSVTGLLLGMVSIGIIAAYTLTTDEKSSPAADPAAQDILPADKPKTTDQPLLTAENTVQKTNTTAPEQTEKNNSTVSQHLQSSEKSVQTPAQQQTSEQTVTEKGIAKPVETNTHVASSSNNERVADPCEHVVLTASILTKPSCDDASNGSIQVPLDQISGGTRPYHIAFNRSKDAGRKELYAYLAAGTYTIDITDANGCSKTFSAEVAEKNCRKASYVFAPDKGQVCTILAKDHEPYVLTILNMAGRQVYKTNTLHENFEWQGLSQQGEYLDAGLYIYILEYASGEKENGQITIVR